MKRCSKCKKEKPLDRFNAHSYNKDGLKTICKLCDSINQKQYRTAERRFKKLYHKNPTEKELKQCT